MKLLIVRHALAAGKEDFASTGLPDSERPATKEGLRAMKKIARGLSRLVPELDAILTSPFLRAVQTAKALARFYPRAELERAPELEPGGDFQELLARIDKMERHETLGLVGHEPFLTRFAGWLLTGEKLSFIDLGKGGAFLLDLEETAREGGAVLEWSLGPKLLPRIKR